jgi:nucleoside-diphosphate-sugar epimerase
MNILIAGGTGLLGSKAADIMLGEGHNVHAIALPPVPSTLNLPKNIVIHLLDFNTMSDENCDLIMKGMDAFVFAAGVDERIEFVAPVMDAYERYNIQPLIKLLSSAKRMGVQKAVILGSYFAHFAKIWPHLNLENHHPYIKSRIRQEEVAFSFADEKFHVNVLELPYIFGPQEGRKPVWSTFIDRFEKPRTIFFPKGGTTMMTTRQVGYAIYHCILYGRQKTAYPLGYVNMTWKKLIPLVLEGMNMEKPVMTIPNWMTHLAFLMMKKGYEQKGIEPGLNPRYFAKLMTSYAYIDPTLSDDLRIPDDDIKQAILASISYAYRIKHEHLDVLDMKTH